jgi:hypothetical protein
MIPKAQVSTLFPYRLPEAYSGAIYRIVPNTSFIFSWLPLNTFLGSSADKPKSAIFALIFC